MLTVFEQFPRFVIGWLVATLRSMMTDPLVFGLTVGSVAFGLIFGVIAAVALFFLVYTLLNTVNNIARGIGMAGQNVGQALVHTANVQLQQPQTPPTPEQ
jgi:hypothetical protein